jgi:phage shock protein E
MNLFLRSVFPVLPVFLTGVFLLAGCGARAGENPPLVDASTLHAQIEAGRAPLIVDVRTAGEFAEGHVPGAVNIPYDQMPVRVAEIIAYKKSPVVLYCRSGRRSGIAAEVLREHEFSTVSLLKGDMPGWERGGFPVDRGES